MENIKDGTAEFRVTDDRLFSILDLIYPVGRIIISNDSTAPYSDIGFGTWQEVAKGAFIEGADDSHKAGDNIDSGLPNITGRMQSLEWAGLAVDNGVYTYQVENGRETAPGGGYGWKSYWVNFDASKSNSIYGKSNTVQPKAYVSHYWLRVK